MMVTKLRISNIGKTLSFFRRYLFIFIFCYGINDSSGQSSNNLIDTLICGKLENGFEYYIKILPQEKALKMDLFVKAGFNFRDDDQFEVPHLLEHMMFRSTKNFPFGINEADSLVKQYGMQGIGRDVFAFTTYKTTKYTFNPNPNYIESIDLGFQFFADILQNLNITRENMNLEKSAIQQEHAMKYSNVAHNRNDLLCSLFPWLESYSHFNEKVDSLSLNSVKRFYKEYYQPQNAALKIVGYVQDPLLLKQKIQDVFGALKPTGEVGRKFNYDSIYRVRPFQFKVQEREHPLDIREDQIDINLFYKDLGMLKDHSFDALEMHQHKILWEMMIEVLEDRLKELQQVYNPKFDVSIQSFVKYRITPALFRMKIMTDSSEIESSLTKVFQKINILRTFGVSKEYFEELKDRISKQFHFKQIDPLNYWSSEITNHITDGVPLLRDKEKMTLDWLNHLTLSEFNTKIDNGFGKKTFDISIQLPKETMRPIDKNGMLTVIENTLNENKIVPTKLIKRPSRLISDAKVSSLEKKEYSLIPDSLCNAHYKFNNGLEIILVNDSSKQGVVSLRAFSDTGSLNFKRSDFYNASYAPSIVQHSGFGDFDKFQLNDYASQWKTFNFYAYVDPHESGIKARVETKYIEELFQYLFLFVTKPRIDEEAFKDWQVSVEKSFINPTYSVEGIDFMNKVKLSLSPHPIAFHSGRDYLERSQEVDFLRSISIFKQLFSRSSDFTYIFTGDFDEKSVLDLSSKYLGNLPNSKEILEIQNDNSYSKTKVSLTKNTIFEKYSGRENEFFIMQSISEPQEYSWKKNSITMLLGELLIDEILNLRLEKKLALYHLSAHGRYDKDLHRYVVMATMDCKQREIDQVKRETRKIFTNFSKGIISQWNYDSALKRLKMKIIENSNKPKNMEMLYHNYSDGNNKIKDFLEEGELLSYVEGLTFEKVKKITRDFFGEENTYEFSM
ncbi:MAG: insulinase family protein [Zunongwangia sp.]|uniref:M16 family metallopeptidase n=1 Tax=Zunongwangia sp. TaxID=1965325 RepID=UPI003242D138